MLSKQVLVDWRVEQILGAGGGGENGLDGRFSSSQNLREIWAKPLTHRALTFPLILMLALQQLSLRFVIFPHNEDRHDDRTHDHEANQQRPTHGNTLSRGLKML